MKRFRRLRLVAAAFWLAAGLCHAQSLGDVARQEKTRKASAPTAKRPALTNDDLPSSGDESPKPPAPPEEKNGKAAARKPETPASRNAAADAFRAKIKQQKQRVAILELQVKELQKAMDRWKTSDCTHVYHPENPYGNACDVPQQLSAGYDQAHKQLQEARSALEDLQDGARRSGFGVKVYDPD